MKPFKTTFLFFVFIIGSNAISLAQNRNVLQRISQLGGVGTDIAKGLACSKNNKTYFTGSFRSTLFADSLNIHTAGIDDIFLACYDNNGSLISLQAGGGKGSDGANCMTVLNNDEIILCGYITDTVSIGNLISESLGWRLFITKRTDAGQFSWLTTLIPSSGAGTSLFLVGSDGNGNIYAAGVYRGALSSGSHSITGNGGRDIFIVKLSPEGTIMDLLSFGGSGDDEVTAMYVSPNGEVYIAGSTRTDIYIGSFLITADYQSSSGYSSDPFILRFNNNFTALWKTQINGTEYCKIESLTQDGNGNLYAAGSYNMNMYVGDSGLYSKGYTDGFLIKYGTSGNFAWARSFGSWYYDYARDVMSDQNGTIVVSGNISDTIQIAKIKIFPRESGKDAAVLMSFSANGREQWGDCITGSGRTEGDKAYFDPNGNIYFSGSFNYGNVVTKTDTLISKGGQDLFLAYYFKCTDVNNEISGRNYVCLGLTTDLSIDQSFDNVLWNDDVSNQHIFTVNQPGLYSVTMTDQDGCTQSDSFEVTLAEAADFSLGDDIFLPVGNSLLLNAPENLENFLWQDGSTNNSFLAAATGNEPGIYSFWLTAKDTLGCSVQDTILIDFYLETGINEPVNSRLKIYPVPANDFLYLTFETGNPGRPLVAEFISLDGRTILSKQVDDYIAGSVMPIDISNIQSGLYYLRLNDGRETINRPCIIKH
jgi:hypothetical protein